MDTRQQRAAEIVAFTPLVRAVVRRFRAYLPSNIETDDLMQAGLIGLNDALTKYQPQCGATFMSYASQRIRGAVLDELRRTDPLPRERRALVRHMGLASEQLEQALGRVPRAQEVAAALGWSLPYLHAVMVDLGISYARLSTEVAEGDILDERGDPADLLQQAQRRAALTVACATLKRRERSVLKHLYEEGMTQAVLSAKLGLSVSRMSQMAKGIARKLRGRLKDV